MPELPLRAAPPPARLPVSPWLGSPGGRVTGPEANGLWAPRLDPPVARGTDREEDNADPGSEKPVAWLSGIGGDAVRDSAIEFPE